MMAKRWKFEPRSTNLDQAKTDWKGTQYAITVFKRGQRKRMAELFQTKSYVAHCNWTSVIKMWEVFDRLLWYWSQMLQNQLSKQTCTTHNSTRATTGQSYLK